MALSSLPILRALLRSLVDLVDEVLMSATTDALERRDFGTRVAEARITGSAVIA